MALDPQFQTQDWVTENSATTATWEENVPTTDTGNVVFEIITSTPVWDFDETTTMFLSNQLQNSTSVPTKPSPGAEAKQTEPVAIVRNIIITDCEACSRDSTQATRHVTVVLAAIVVLFALAILVWIVWRRRHRRRKEIINVSMSERVQNFHLKPKSPALLPNEVDNFHVISFSQGPHPPVALSTDKGPNSSISLDCSKLIDSPIYASIDHLHNVY